MTASHKKEHLVQTEIHEISVVTQETDLAMILAMNLGAADHQEAILAKNIVLIAEVVIQGLKKDRIKVSTEAAEVVTQNLKSQEAAC